MLYFQVNRSLILRCFVLYKPHLSSVLSSLFGAAMLQVHLTMYLSYNEEARIQHSIHINEQRNLLLFSIMIFLIGIFQSSLTEWPL